MRWHRKVSGILQNMLCPMTCRMVLHPRVSSGLSTVFCCRVCLCGVSATLWWAPWWRGSMRRVLYLLRFPQTL